MSWEKLPALGSPRRPPERILAAVQIHKAGSPMLVLTISLPLAERLGAKPGCRADVYADGDKVKIEFGPDLGASIAFMRTCRIVRCPLPPAVPSASRPSAMSEILEVTTGGVVLRLPLAAWQGIKVTAARPPPSAPAPASAGAKNDRGTVAGAAGVRVTDQGTITGNLKVDAGIRVASAPAVPASALRVDEAALRAPADDRFAIGAYLRKKGHGVTCSTGSDTALVDGIPTTLADALARVNEYRKDLGLARLLEANVRW